MIGLPSIFSTEKSSEWFLKTIVFLAITFALIAGIYDPAVGQQFDISAAIYPESLTVGDKFLYINTVDVEDGYTVEPLPLTDQLGDAFVLSDIYKLEKSGDGALAFACTLAVYKPGEIELPAFTFIATDTAGISEEFTGEGITAEIRSVLPADTTGLEIADIREPHKLTGPIWPYFVVPVALALLIYGMILLRRRLGGRALIPVVPPRPPWEIAFERLDSLKSSRHLEFGRFRLYYFELSMIARGYIEGRYDFPAVESTTYELENECRLGHVDDDLYNRLFEFFHRADMAKFAKAVPAPAEAESDLSFAYEFVRKTIPLIEKSLSEKPEFAEAVG
jgi:hypothetical protein